MNRIETLLDRYRDCIETRVFEDDYFMGQGDEVDYARRAEQIARDELMAAIRLA